MTHVLALLGRRACREAPFKKSFSSASLPTSRSSAAMRASYSASTLAAAVSLSSAPASCLAIQMRIRLLLMSYRLASPWRVSPGQIVLDDLPLELDRIAAVLGHGLSPRKPGRNSLIRVTSPVHPVGCTPLTRNIFLPVCRA